MNSVIKKIRISAVSYLNTFPFIFGIRNSGLLSQIELSLDTPTDCALKLKENKADIGLIPVAAIPDMKESFIITDFCISASGNVNSVLLLSEVPLKKIKIILPDYQSLTSVQLLKILLKHHWNIHPQFKDSKVGYESEIKNETAGLVIGDRALTMRKNFHFVYDLSEAWFEMTSLPFVFACWVSNKKMTGDFIIEFNKALAYGVENIDQAIRKYDGKAFSFNEIESYLKKSISYQLDDHKRKGMKLFFDFLKREENFLMPYAL